MPTSKPPTSLQTQPATKWGSNRDEAVVQRLSGMDAAFLYGETPSWHMHAGALLILDRGETAERFDAERLRTIVRGRLDRLGPFRYRLVEVPFGLDRPLWVADSELDLNSHIREVGVPAPGGRKELARLVGGLFGPKLDRDRPLWELWVIEGLEDDKVAVLAKVHHSLADGVRGAALYETLFDTTPDAPIARPGARPPQPERTPSEAELFGRALWSLAGTPVRAAKAMVHLLGSGLGLARLRRSPSWSSATLPFQAPRTSLNQAITPRRGFAYTTVSLDDVKMVKDSLGVKVNDVVLAICAGALRSYLVERGELPPEPLVAQVPVAVARETSGPEAAGGNFISVVGTRLATDVEDPLERLRTIHEAMVAAKQMHEAMGDEVLLDAAEVVPPSVMAAGVRAYSRLRLAEHHAPLFNLIISNVPGPSIPLYVGGARLVANYPLGPLLDGGGLNITVMSYCNSVDFGFAVCPDVVDQPWKLADAASAAAAELIDAARSHLSTHGPASATG